jgi:hypothetical protein
MDQRQASCVVAAVREDRMAVTMTKNTENR